MRRLNLLFGVMLFLLVLPILSAQTYQRTDLIDLKIPYEVNGSAADATANCNISIQYPNTTYIVENGSMTNRNNGEFNYSLVSNFTSVLGEHNWVAFCCQGGVNCAAGYGSIEITQTGREKLNSGEGISLFIAIFVMIIIGVFIFLMAFRFESSAGKIICVGLAMVIFAVAILYSLVILDQNFGGFSAFTTGYATFWMVIKTFLGVIFTFFLLYCFLLAFRLWKIKRGLMDEED